MATLQAALGGEIGIGHYEVLAHGMCADGLQQEALARAVSAHEKTERGAAVGNEGKVGEQRPNLGLAAHRDIGQTDARHHAAFERVQDDGRDPLGYARCVCCVVHIPSTSRRSSR